MTKLSNYFIETLASLNISRLKILDVGCGDGCLSSLILKKNPSFEVTGIDVVKRESLFMPVAVFDGSIIPYQDSSFDVVMFSDVLHHIVEFSGLLKEAKRVSRKFIVIKDHKFKTLLEYKFLCFMDCVANCPHGVKLPLIF